MRLRPINPDWYRGLKLCCCVCGKMFPSKVMVSDLDGEWFKAYYCPKCKPEEDDDEPSNSDTTGGVVGDS